MKVNNPNTLLNKIDFFHLESGTLRNIPPLKKETLHIPTLKKWDKGGFLTAHFALNFLFIHLLLFLCQFSISETMPYKTDRPLYIGSRPIGMGNAYVGLVDSAESGFWNPAGLIQYQGVRVFFAGKLLDREEDVFDSKSIAFCYRNTALFWGNKIALRLKNDDTQDYNYYSLAQKLNSHIALGASAKFKRRHPSDYYQFFGYKADYDLGVLIKPDPYSSLGLLIQKLDDHKKLINAITFGLCYKHSERILFVYDIAILSNDDLSFEHHIGWEYNIKNWLLLRVGLSDKTPTAGLGIKISNFQFDYAVINKLSFLSAQMAL